MYTRIKWKIFKIFNFKNITILVLIFLTLIYSKLKPSKILIIQNQFKASENKLTSQPLPQLYIKPSVTKKAIILVAFHRTGSSFTGELLNIHPDVFYLYEPLKLITDGCHRKEEERIGLIENIIGCKIPGPEASINPLLTQTSLRNDIIFRTKSQRLCSAEFCNGYNASSNPFACSKCPKVDLDQASLVCRNLIPGIKLIRLCEIDLIQRMIFSNPGVDFKLPVLVRDPRGIFQSRHKIFKEKMDSKQLVKNVKWTCRSMFQIADAIKYRPELKNKIKIFRYEDISRDPLKGALKFYKFVNLPMTDAIHQKIITMTTSSSQNKLHSNSSYSTSKDSKHQFQDWRNGIDLDSVKMIQEDPDCKKSMNEFGYKSVYDDEVLRDLEHELVEGKVNTLNF